MPEYNAGDAKLRIVPDASAFKKDLEAKLKTIQVDYAVKVTAQLAQAKSDMQRFRAEEQNRAINQRVNPQFSRAREELAAFRAEQRANAINIPVHADTNAASTAIRGLTSQLGEGTRGAKDLGSAISKIASSAVDVSKVIGITGLIANIPAAVTAVASLGQALSQLSGAALAVPGAIGGAVASIGTLAVGLSGIKDAYTAVTAAAEESSTGQTERARAAASATQSLRNAVVDEAQAQKDVAVARRDARQELQDLNLEMRGGQISIAQAENDAAKARRDLAKGGFKDALDLRDAQLRVAESDQRVAEAKSRQSQLVEKTNDANAKGVEGSDRVVAANERVVRSQQAVASAQQSLTDATGTSVAAADKAAAAMAKLSPQAADFVKTLVALKPRWTDLQKTISGNLFEGASVSFTQFVNKVLPNLKTGMASIATAWNSNIKALLGSLGSDNSKGLLDRILGNTSEAQNRFSAAIDPLVRGIGTLTAAGSDALPRLADAIGSIATRFAAFIETADKDGRLQRWIDQGLTGFTDLGRILLNIGKSFLSITQAIGGPGLLSSLSNLTERMATFLSSVDGQATLKRFFAEGREEIEKLKPIVKNIIDILPDIWRGAKDAWDLVSPIIREFTELLAKTPGLVSDITTAFIAWQSIKGVSSLVTSLGTVTKLLTGMPALATTAAGTGGIGGLGTAVTALASNPVIAALLAALGFGAGIGPVLNAGPDARAAAARARLNEEASRNPGVAALIGPTQGPAQGPVGPGSGPQLPVSPPVGPAQGTPGRPGGTVIPVTPLDPNNPFAGYASGGPSDAGLAVLHDNEFVLSARASKYPMSFKHALNEGRIDPRLIPHFYNGGPFRTDKPNQDGALGPTGPAPTEGGPQAVLSDLLGGLQGPISRVQTGGPTPPGFPAPPPAATPSTPAPTAPAPGSKNSFYKDWYPVGGSTPKPGDATPSTDIPHGTTGGAPIGPDPIPSNAPTPGTDPLAGSPVPGPPDFLHQWFPWLPPEGQAIDANQILAGLPDKLQPLNIAKQAGQIALGFVSGFFGLDLSYLSAAGQAIDFYGNKFGQSGASGYDPTAEFGGLPGTPGGTGIPGATGLLNPASQASSFGGAKTTYTPDFLKAHGIAPLYTRSTDAKGNNVANIPAWATQLASAFHLTATSHVDSTLHGGAGNSPGGGWAFDFSGSPENEQQFADFIKTNLSGQTLQLIWQNPKTGAQDGIAGGQILGRNEYYTDPGGSYADHTDHVHWATDVQPNLIDPTTGKSFLAAGPDALKAFSTGAGQAGGTGVSRTGDLKSRAYQAYLAAGLPPGEWSDFDQLIQHESSWQPTIKNPGSTAYGLGQFLDTTWASVGGTKTSDPMTQLQYIFAYLKQRPDYHGSPAAAWSLWQSRSPHWYDSGGILPPGLTLAMNKTGRDERILNPAQTAQYERMLPHFDNGGLFRLGVPVPKPTPPPLPRGPEARPKIAPPIPVPTTPAPIPTAPAPAAPAPAQPAPETQPPAEATPPPQQAAPPPPEAAQQGPAVGPTGGPPTNADTMHLHPALQKGITSGFAVAGNLAQAAATFGLAAGGAGAGAGGLGGAGGGGGGGPSISGAFQQFGKIAVNAANVGASLLVGSDKLGGDTGNAYGRTYRPPQQQPATAQSNSHTTNYNGGIVVADPNELRRELDLRDAQQYQSAMASHL